MQSLVKRLQRVDPARFQKSWEWVEDESIRDSIRVVLTPTHSHWSRMAPAWAAGYAVPQTGLIVIFPERVVGYPYDSLETVLVHEVAHILIGRAARGNPIPRWFDEGLAMVASRTWALEDQARLTWALVAAEPVSFADIDGLFGKDRASANRGYTLADAIVRYCIHAYGPSWPHRMLRSIAHGATFHEALLQTTSRPVSQVEAAFWATQTLWSRWIPVLASSAVLWIGIVALAIWVFKKQRRRAEAVRKQWQEEDPDL